MTGSLNLCIVLGWCAVESGINFSQPAMNQSVEVMCITKQERKFWALAELGAGEFRHLNGSLENHLISTAKLLETWGSRDALCDAGLYHAAYGTAAFDQAMVSLQMRGNIAAIIGEDAEKLVYLYCSCERDFTFAHINAKAIEFRDRFTNKEFTLTPQQARDFCELTVANEMELVTESADFKERHVKGLLALFESMSPWLSDLALASYKTTLVP